MLFRQFFLVAIFSALAGAALAKIMVGPAPANSWAVGHPAALVQLNQV